MKHPRCVTCEGNENKHEMHRSDLALGDKKVGDMRAGVDQAGSALNVEGVSKAGA